MRKPDDPFCPAPGVTATVPTVLAAPVGQEIQSRVKLSGPPSKSQSGMTSREVSRSVTRKSSKTTSPGTAPKRMCSVARLGSLATAVNSRVITCEPDTGSGEVPGAPQKRRARTGFPSTKMRGTPSAAETRTSVACSAASGDEQQCGEKWELDSLHHFLPSKDKMTRLPISWVSNW